MRSVRTSSGPFHDAIDRWAIRRPAHARQRGDRDVTSILGISAFYHDSAATLVVDGEIVAAAQEERFTRRKHDPEFPSLAADYCLR